MWNKKVKENAIADSIQNCWNLVTNSIFNGLACVVQIEFHIINIAYAYKLSLCINR